MSDQLVQRSGLIRRSYTLTAEGIRTSQSSVSGGKTVTVPYEAVFGETVEVWSASRRALVAVIVMAGISIFTMFGSDADRLAWLFWAIGAAFAGAYYLFSRHDQIGFYDGSARLMFFRGKPSEAAFEVFLEKIRQRARERVRDRLWPLRPSGDARTDRERIHALRDKGIISEQECVEFERELAGRPIRVNERLEN